MTKLTISEKTYKKLKNLEYLDDISDALCEEMEAHKGIDWTDYKSIVNTVYSIVLCGDEVEIEEESLVDQFTDAVLFCAYDQATARVAKVLGYSPAAFKETIDLFLDMAEPDQQYPIPHDEFMDRYKEIAITYGEDND